MDMSPNPMPSPPQVPARQPPKLSKPQPLSASQEAQVRALYYANVRARCAAEIQAFAACAVNRTVTVTWMCRGQRLAMNSCMVAHATVEEEDRAREEWFCSLEAKRRERELESEKVELRRKEVIELIKKQEEKELSGSIKREDEGCADRDGGIGEASRRGGGFWGSARR